MDVLILGLIHVIFLIAIGKRLAAIGYPGASIIRLVFASFTIWAASLFIGVVANIAVLKVGAGLSMAILSAGIWYGWLEIRALLETADERRARVKAVQNEQEEHEREVINDNHVISQMVPVKNYVGDGESILAIRDLGRLQEHGIRCRIEGSLVKTLFIPESEVGRVSQFISIQVQDSNESETQDAVPTSEVDLPSA